MFSYMAKDLEMTYVQKRDTMYTEILYILL